MSNNLTTELRKLLDERGVEWWEGDDACKTYWVANDTMWEYFNDENNDVWFGLLSSCESDVTPKQAITATLGSEREKALEELVREMWYEMITCPDYVRAPCLTISICERVRNLGIVMNK